MEVASAASTGALSPLPADFWIAGAAVVAALTALSWLSSRFVYGEGHGERPLEAVVLLHLAASAAWAHAVYRAARSGAGISPRARVAILAIALLPRLALLGSSPVQEDDFYRYLWDGQVVRAGVDPYRFSPDEVRAALPDDADPALARLARLRDQTPAATLTFERINHPRYSTIYPPGAVLVFALASLVAPWKSAGLRAVFLLLDGATIVLLAGLLRRLGRPPALIVAYAWSPLVVKEVVNGAHMDVLPALLALATLAALLSGRPVTAGLALGAGIASKLYPLLLAPAVAAYVLRRAPRSFAAARIVRAREERLDEATALAFAACSVGVFLLSPAQFPWYFSWVVPWLALYPSPPLILLAGTLGLYTMGFRADGVALLVGEDAAVPFRRAILWAEHAPVLGLALVSAALTLGRGRMRLRTES